MEGERIEEAREEQEEQGGRKRGERSYSTYGGAVVVVEVAEHQLIVYQQQLEYGDLGEGEVKRKVS